MARPRPLSFTAELERVVTPEIPPATVFAVIEQK